MEDLDKYRETEIEIAYRNPIPYKDRIQVCNSETAQKFFRDNWNEDRIELIEEFKIMLLDRANHYLGISTICSGGISSCDPDIRLIFATALVRKASGIALAHNHPSGSLVASDEDINLTGSIQEIGRMLQIPVLDHLVLTQESYMSMADSSALPYSSLKRSFQSR